MDIRIENLPVLSGPLTGTEELLVEHENDNYRVSLNTLADNNIDFIYPHILSFKPDTVSGFNIEFIEPDIGVGETRTYLITNYDSFIDHTLTAINGVAIFVPLIPSEVEYVKTTPPDVMSAFGVKIKYTAPSTEGPCGFIIDGRTINLNAVKIDLGFCYKISDPEPNYGNQFGTAIDMSADGSTIIVSSDVNDNYNAGRVRIFTLNSLTDEWELEATIESPIQSLTTFGASLSINYDGTILAIGAYTYYDESIFSHTGCVYIYNKFNGTWNFETQLLPDDGNIYAQFGFSLDLDLDTIIIGSPEANFERGEVVNKQGCAYIFKYINSVWTQVAKLTGSITTGDDSFGFSVAISGGTAVISAIHTDFDGMNGTGCVYVFGSTVDIPAWTEYDILTASDKNVNDELGWSVDTNGTYIIASIRNKNTGDVSYNGRVYVYQINNITDKQFTQVYIASPSNSNYIDNFGISVSMSMVGHGNNTLFAVGANFINVDNLTAVGSTYVYYKNPSDVWVEHAILVPTSNITNSADYKSFDLFGSSVSISEDGSKVASSSPLYDMMDVTGPGDNKFDTGAVYVCGTSILLGYGG